MKTTVSPFFTLKEMPRRISRLPNLLWRFSTRRMYSLVTFYPAAIPKPGMANFFSTFEIACMPA